MSIEAEIKAHVRDAADLHARLRQWSDPEVAVYSDVYLDRGGALAADDRELRVRRVRVDDDTTTLLTYKGEVVDAGSGSKTEVETAVADADALIDIVKALGYEAVVAFDKHCTNYRFTRGDRSMLATVVEVPQIEGTFIEVESLVPDSDDVGVALDAIRDVLDDLGITRADETRDTYTGAVLTAERDA